MNEHAVMKLAARVAWVLVTISSLAQPVDADAGQKWGPALHVKAYPSPSGKYALEIDPSDLYGRGEGRYRMTVEGKEKWAATFPFTLYEAVVSDDGVAAGYAYSFGIDGFPIHGAFSAGPGDLQVVIIDPRGRLRLREKVKREHSGVPHAPPDPIATGILLHSQDDRFTVRVDTKGRENWWSYRLSTGKRLKRFQLESAGERFALAAKAITGTPLTLMHWWRYDGKTRQAGAQFALVDANGKQVWSLALPADYAKANDENAEAELHHTIRKRGAILDASEPAKFELWFVSEGQRVRHVVEKADKEWRVSEIERRPYESSREEKSLPAIEERPLELLGTFVLKDAAPAGPIRDLEWFEFDSRGRIGFLRGEGRRGYAFVLIEQSGAVLVEIALPVKVENTQVKLAWTAEDRWLLTASDSSGEAKARAWWLEVEKRALSEIADFDCPSIESLAGTGDGGFVALATRRSRYTMTDELLAFDVAGRQRWKLEQHYGGGAEALFSPEDMTVTSRGEIAVVDNIREQVQLFDLNGTNLRTIDLKKSWKREPNYPSDITPDADGGFIVYDFGNNPPFVRMKADGSVREQVRPKHADGRPVDTRGGVRVAPDGRLWASDRHALLRLGDKGVVVQVVGHPPDNELLGNIAAVTGDSRGHLYAVDERTASVHVFDGEGKKVRVCKPAKDDFSGNVSWPHIEAADDGSVYLQSGPAERSYLHFAADGSRLGIKTLKVDSIHQEWHPLGSTGQLLVLGFQAAFLVSKNGKTIREINRRPDRKWLDRPDAAAVAPDGTFAILATRSDMFGSDPTINFYTAGGDPLRTAAIPFPLADLSGLNSTHLVLRHERECVLFDDRGTPAQKFVPPIANGEWDQFLTRDGRELWVFEFLARKVTRYAMP